MKLLSVIVPCCNEEENIFVFFQELNKNVKAVITEQEPSDEPAPVITRDLASVLKERENKLIEEEANLKVKYQQLMQVADSKADEILSNAVNDLTTKTQEVPEERTFDFGKPEPQEDVKTVEEVVEDTWQPLLSLPFH